MTAPTFDCYALLNDASPGALAQMREAAERGLCLHQQAEIQPSIPQIQPAQQAGVGLPFPLLLVGGVLAVYKGLEVVGERKSKRDFEEEKSKTYAVKDAGSPSSGMVPIRPHRERVPYDAAAYGANPWEGVGVGVAKGGDTLRHPQPEPVPGGRHIGDTPAVTHRQMVADEPMPAPSDTAPDMTGIDPLAACPLDIGLPPSSGERRAVEWCLYKCKTKEETIRLVWGLSKNGRKESRYSAASARYLGYAEQWATKWGDQNV